MGVFFFSPSTPVPLSTPHPPLPPQLAWGHRRSESSCKRGHSNSPPLMTERLRGRKTNFHRQNDLLVLSQLLFRPLPFFRLSELTGDDSSSETGRVMTSPTCMQQRSADAGMAALARPPDLEGGRGGQPAAAGRAAFPGAFPQVLAGSQCLLLSGLTVVTSLAAVHTVSSAQNIFTLRNTRCLIPALASPVSFAARV